MSAKLTLSKFEALDGALSAYLHAKRGNDGRHEIRCFNRLYDAVIEEVGFDRASDMSDAQIIEHVALRVGAYLMAA